MIALKSLLVLILFPLFIVTTQASGVRGTVKSDDGTFLAYATIFVKQTGSGTTTNMDGYFEIQLSPGSYEFVFQYLGYQTEVRQLEVKDTFVELHIILKTQVTVLETVTV